MTSEEVDHCEFWTGANREVRESGRHNCQGKKIPINSKWDLELLEEWLEDYQDKGILKYLRYGWPLNAQNTEINTDIPINSN